MKNRNIFLIGLTLHALRMTKPLIIHSLCLAWQISLFRKRVVAVDRRRIVDLKLSISQILVAI